jgi:hypothetical protein
VSLPNAVSPSIALESNGKPLLTYCGSFLREPSGRSAYAATGVLPELLKHFSLRLVSDRRGALILDAASYPVMNIDDLRAADGGYYQGAYLIHLEDDAAAAALADLAVCAPAALWLHDYYLRSGGTVGDLLRNAASGTRRVFFSSERNVDAWRRHGLMSAVPVRFLPYPVSCFVSRRRSGGPIRLASTCRPLVEDQIHRVLAALRASQLEAELHWLIDEDEYRTAERVLAEYPDLKTQLHSGRCGEHWEKLLVEADIAIHLHHSGCGDPGPFLAQSLAAGVLVAVSDYSDGALLPASAVLKIFPGQDGGTQLTTLFENLRDEQGRELAFERGSKARKYAEEIHTADTVAGELAAEISRMLSEHG